MGDNMTFTRCSLTSALNITTSKDLGDTASLADPTATLALSYSQNLTSGRGDNNGNLAYWWSGTIAASSSQAFDLVGSLSDAFGDTVNFDIVKYIMVRNTSTASTLRLVATSLVTWISGAADYVVIPPEGVFMLGGPNVTVFDVSAGSDTITLTNTSSTTAATYQIGIVGVEVDSSSSESSSSSSHSSSSSSSHSVSSSSSHSASSSSSP